MNWQHKEPPHCPTCDCPAEWTSAYAPPKSDRFVLVWTGTTYSIGQYDERGWTSDLGDDVEFWRELPKGPSSGSTAQRIEGGQ